MWRKIWEFFSRDRSRQLSPIQVEILKILADDLGSLELGLELGTLEWGLAIIKSLQDRQMSGLAILDALQENPNFKNVGIGRLYPALFGLEKDFLIQSRFLSGSPPRRKMFNITPAGFEALKELDS